MSSLYWIFENTNMVCTYKYLHLLFISLCNPLNIFLVLNLSIIFSLQWCYFKKFSYLWFQRDMTDFYLLILYSGWFSCYHSVINFLILLWSENILPMILIILCLLKLILLSRMWYFFYSIVAWKEFVLYWWMECL